MLNEVLTNQAIQGSTVGHHRYPGAAVVDLAAASSLHSKHVPFIMAKTKKRQASALTLRRKSPGAETRDLTGLCASASANPSASLAPGLAERLAEGLVDLYTGAVRQDSASDAALPVLNRSDNSSAAQPRLAPIRKSPRITASPPLCLNQCWPGQPGPIMRDQRPSCRPRPSLSAGRFPSPPLPS